MTIHIDKVGNRIHLRSSDRLSRIKERIPGASFSDRSGFARWSIPLSIEHCYLLRELFGGRLEVGPALAAWARSYHEQTARMAKIRAKKSTKLKRVGKRFPALHAAVTEGRRYQSVGAKWIKSGRTVLIADGVGLGKSAQALAGVIEAGVPGPFLIVCPKTAVEATWAKEVRDWLPGEEVITLPEGRAKREAALQRLQEGRSLAHTWVIVHPYTLRTKSWWICRECRSETPLTHKPKALVCEHDARRTTTRHDHVFPELFAVKWGAVIADESDSSLIRVTGSPTQVRRGMELLRDEAMAPQSVRIAQSATPWRSRPKLLWSTLNWLRPAEFTSFWNWAGLFFDVQGGYGGTFKIGGLRPDREDAFYASLDRIMLRRTRSEVASYLPRKQYIGRPLGNYEGSGDGPVAVWLPLTPPQAKAYAAMEGDASAELEGGRLDAIGTLAVHTRLQQLATTAGVMERGEYRPALPSNKFEYLVQMLEELGYPDDPQAKVVVVSRFTQVLALFRKELETKWGADLFAEVSGRISGTRRAADIEAFNRPVGSGPHVMFLNTEAGGTAITLDSADEMVFLDQTWVPDQMEQVEGRIDNRRPEERIVQRRYRYLLSEGTVDEAIAIVNMERDGVTREILDGRRGVQILRSVVGG